MNRTMASAKGLVTSFCTECGALGQTRSTLRRAENPFCISLRTLLMSLAAAIAAHAADTHVLFDFENNFDPGKTQATDARVSLVRSGEGQALRIETGDRQAWPGVTLRAPAGPWDLSRFSSVSLQARNVGTDSVSINCRVDNPGADGMKHCVTGSTTVQPGAKATIRVELKRAAPSTLGGKLFGLRGYPVAPGGDRTIDARNVTQLMIFLAKPNADHAFEIDDIRAEGVYTAPTAWVTDADPYFPLIDTFGQYRHKDWPGKVHSMDELKQRRESEIIDLAARPESSDWDRFGGWNGGPQLKATGFFRTEKHSGKWWLVDPEGKLFWSHGIDCVRMQEFTAISGRESWFQDFPGDQTEFAPFAMAQGRVLKGHYAGQSPRGFSFASANLLRKYGDHWRGASTDIAHRRMRSWGLNTIGNWSDEGVRLERRTPYVDSLSSGNARRIEGSEGYWSKFVDPFDASFRESLRRSMTAKLGKSAGDPWCIGFFSDNEIAWGDEVSLALAALQSPPDQPAKKELVADLKAVYGEVAKLNMVWGTTHPSWEAVLQARTAPDKQKARKDLEAFYSKIADAYFRAAREILKQSAPNQLYLGCRFAWGNALAAASAAKFCDVVSYNLYRRSVADFQFNGGADVPMIIGEFHFGALDRGMFHTGLVPTANQAARAQAYSDYVRGALRHPQFVGCHWFQYQDQPTTGRTLDEENYQIGFLDIADTPYRETVAAARDVGYALYSIRTNAAASGD